MTSISIVFFLKVHTGRHYLGPLCKQLLNAVSQISCDRAQTCADTHDPCLACVSWMSHRGSTGQQKVLTAILKLSSLYTFCAQLIASFRKVAVSVVMWCIAQQSYRQQRSSMQCKAVAAYTDHQSLQSGRAPAADGPASTGRGWSACPSGDEGTATHTACTAAPPSASVAHQSCQKLQRGLGHCWVLGGLSGRGIPTLLLDHVPQRAWTSH